MINRSLLRIKVIQILYSYYKNKENETIELESAENELIESTDKTYELYHYFFLLIIKIADYAKRMEKKEAAAGLNISKFNNNLFIEQLRKNNALLTYFNDHDVDWADIVEDNELFWTIQYEEQQNDPSRSCSTKSKSWRSSKNILRPKRTTTSRIRRFGDPSSARPFPIPSLWAANWRICPSIGTTMRLM